MMASLKVTDTDLDEWEKLEVRFFDKLRQENEMSIIAITYMELLQKLHAAAKLCDSSSALFIWSMPGNFLFVPPVTQDVHSYSAEAAVIRRLKSKRYFAKENFERILQEVNDVEL